MIENFLPIPDAPNYEINSDLVCRVIKTKQPLKLQPRKNMQPYYSLRNKDKTKFTIKRSPKLLRRQAVVATQKGDFEPIPSTGGKYEINPRGVVRNAKTKHILKRKGHDQCVGLQLGGRTFVTRSIKDLLWEVHGIIKPRRFRPAPCSAEHSNYGRFFFESKKACARFLAPKLFLAVSTVTNHLYKRDKIFYGWTINYD